MFVDDLHSFHDSESICTFDAFHFLLAGLAHVEGVAVVGIEVLDAQNRFLLQSAFGLSLLLVDGKGREPNDRYQQKDHGNVTSTDLEGVLNVRVGAVPLDGSYGHDSID